MRPPRSGRPGRRAADPAAGPGCRARLWSVAGLLVDIRNLWLGDAVKRLIHYFAALLAMLLALAGCSGGGTGAPSAPAEELYNKQVVLAAPRDLSPGEKDGYYSSLILQV